MPLIYVVISTLGHLVLMTYIGLKSMFGLAPESHSQTEPTNVQAEALLAGASPEKVKRELDEAALKNVVTVDQLVKMAQQALRNFKAGKPAELPISLGEFLIWTEAHSQDLIAKDPRKVLYYLKMYSELQARALQYNRLKVSEEERINGLRQYLHNNFYGDYKRDEALLINILDGQGNCDAESRLITAVFLDTGVVIPSGKRFATEIFSKHIRPILFDSKTGSVEDLVYANRDPEVRSAVYRPEVLLWSFLNRQGVDKIVESKELLLSEREHDTLLDVKGAESKLTTNGNFIYPKAGGVFRETESELFAKIKFKKLGEQQTQAIKKQNGALKKFADKWSEGQGISADFTRDNHLEELSYDIQLLTGILVKGPEVKNLRPLVKSHLANIQTNAQGAPVVALRVEVKSDLKNNIEDDKNLLISEDEFLQRHGFVFKFDPFFIGIQERKMNAPGVTLREFPVRSLVVSTPAQRDQLLKLAPPQRFATVMSMVRLHLQRLIASNSFSDLIAFVESPINTLRDLPVERIKAMGPVARDVLHLQKALYSEALLDDPDESAMKTIGPIAADPTVYRFLLGYFHYINLIKKKPAVLLRTLEEFSSEKIAAFYDVNQSFVGMDILETMVNSFDIAARKRTKDDAIAERASFDRPLEPLLRLVMDPKRVGLKVKLQEPTSQMVVFDVTPAEPMQKLLNQQQKPEPNHDQRSLVAQIKQEQAKIYVREVNLLGAFLSQPVEVTKILPVNVAFIARLTPALLEASKQFYYSNKFKPIFANYFDTVVPDDGGSDLPMSVVRTIAQRFPGEALYQLRSDKGRLHSALGTVKKITVPRSLIPFISLESWVWQPSQGGEPVTVKWEAFQKDSRFNYNFAELDSDWSDNAKLGTIYVRRDQRNGKAWNYSMLNRCTGEDWIYVETFDSKQFAVTKRQEKAIPCIDVDSSAQPNVSN